MKNLIFALCAALAVLTAAAGNASEIAVKQVTLDEFMQGHVMGNIQVPVIVPKEFEPAKLPKANFGYSYWMKPGDVSASNTSGDLPETNGYMFGTLSPNVGYDDRRNIFIGLEDSDSIAQAKKILSELKLERYKFGKHAVVLLSFSMNGKRAYSMYVATNIDTNVVYIAIRPAGNSREIGDSIWNQLKKSLEKP
jgi:hypothetical protein